MPNENISKPVTGQNFSTIGEAKPLFTGGKKDNYVELSSANKGNLYDVNEEMGKSEERLNKIKDSNKKYTDEVSARIAKTRDFIGKNVFGETFSTDEDFRKKLNDPENMNRYINYIYKSGIEKKLWDKDTPYEDIVNKVKDWYGLSVKKNDDGAVYFNPELGYESYKTAPVQMKISKETLDEATSLVDGIISDKSRNAALGVAADAVGKALNSNATQIAVNVWENHGDTARMFKNLSDGAEVVRKMLHDNNGINIAKTPENDRWLMINYAATYLSKKSSWSDGASEASKSIDNIDAKIKASNNLPFEELSIDRLNANTEDQENLKAAKRLAKETKRIYEKADMLDGDIIDYAKALGHKATDANNWLCGLVELKDGKRIDAVLTKIENAYNGSEDAVAQYLFEGKDGVLSESERVLLNAYVSNMNATLDREGTISMWVDAGDTTGDAIPMMAEFALTGGLVTASEEALTGLIKVLSKSALKNTASRRCALKLLKAYRSASKYRERIKPLTESAKKAGVADTRSLGMKAANIAADVAETAAGDVVARGTAQTIFDPRTYTSAKVAELKKLKFDDNGRMVINNGSDLDVEKAIWDNYIEVCSERSGTITDKFFGMFKVGKFLTGGKFDNKFFRAFRGLLVSNKQLSKYAGVGSTVSELTEEIYGEFARYAKGLQTQEEFDNFFTADNIESMVWGFAGMGILGGAVNVVSRAEDLKKLDATRNSVISELISLGRNTYEANNLIKAIDDAKTGADIAAAIDNATEGMNFAQQRSVRINAMEYASRKKGLELRDSGVDTEVGFGDRSEDEITDNDMARQAVAQGCGVDESYVQKFCDEHSVNSTSLLRSLLSKGTNTIKDEFASMVNTDEEMAEADAFAFDNKTRAVRVMNVDGRLGWVKYINGSDAVVQFPVTETENEEVKINVADLQVVREYDLSEEGRQDTRDNILADNIFKSTYRIGDSIIGENGSVFSIRDVVGGTVIISTNEGASTSVMTFEEFNDAINNGVFKPAIEIGEKITASGKTWKVTARRSSLFDGSDDFIMTRIDKDGNPVTRRVASKGKWNTFVEEQDMPMSNVLKLRAAQEQPSMESENKSEDTKQENKAAEEAESKATETQSTDNNTEEVENEDVHTVPTMSVGNKAKDIVDVADGDVRAAIAVVSDYIDKARKQAEKHTKKAQEYGKKYNKKGKFTESKLADLSNARADYYDEVLEELNIMAKDMGQVDAEEEEEATDAQPQTDANADTTTDVKAEETKPLMEEDGQMRLFNKSRGEKGTEVNTAAQRLAASITTEAAERLKKVGVNVKVLDSQAEARELAGEDAEYSYYVPFSKDFPYHNEEKASASEINEIKNIVELNKYQKNGTDIVSLESEGRTKIYLIDHSNHKDFLENKEEGGDCFGIRNVFDVNDITEDEIRTILRNIAPFNRNSANWFSDRLERLGVKGEYMRRIDVDAELKVGRSTYDSMANAGNRKRTASGRNGRSADGRENKTGRNKKGGKQFSIAAYHGTALDKGTLPFDKFDWIRHQLEGEGAMVFGAGSYVTGAERIGRHYADVAQQRKKQNIEYTDEERERADELDEIRNECLSKINDAISKTAQEWDDIDDDEVSSILKYHMRGLVDKNVDDKYDNIQDAIDAMNAEVDNKYDFTELANNTISLFEQRREAIQEKEEIINRPVSKYLYSVEIPDDDKTNYIQWDKNITLDQAWRLYNAIWDDKDFSDEFYMSSKYGFEPSLNSGIVLLSRRPPQLDEEYTNNIRGESVYQALSKQLGSDEAASKWLSEHGFTGIKVPQGYAHGRSDNGEDYNYVIFNDDDIQIKDRVQFLMNDATIYGWQENNDIYLTPDGVNPNTPVHEYTHLWSKAVQKGNPALWERCKDMAKTTAVWEEVMNDSNYANIHQDEDAVASEVLARLTGRLNAEMTVEEAEKILGGREEYNDEDKKTLLDTIKSLLNEFWSWIGENIFNLKPENIKSWEDVSHKVMYDYFNGSDILSNGIAEDNSKSFSRTSGVSSRDEALDKLKNLDGAEREAFTQEQRDIRHEYAAGEVISDLANITTSSYKRPEATSMSEALHAFLAPSVTFDMMMRKLGSDSPMGEGAAWNYFMKEWNDVRNREINRKMAIEDAMWGMANVITNKVKKDSNGNAVSTRDGLNALMDKGKQYATTLHYEIKDNDGNIKDEGELDITYAQCAMMYAWSKQEGSEIRFAGKNCGLSMDEVNKAIDTLKRNAKELVEFADWVQEDLFPTLWSDYRRQMMGDASLVEDYDNYFPFVADIFEYGDTGTSSKGNGTFVRQFRPSATKKREAQSSFDVKNNDFFSLLLGHVRSLEKQYNYRELIDDLDYCFGGESNVSKNDIVPAVHMLGANVLEDIKKCSQILVGQNGGVESVVDTKLGRLLGNITSSKISFKINVAAKQALSATTYNEYGGKVAWEVVKVMANVKDAKNTFDWVMENCPMMLERWNKKNMGNEYLGITGGVYSMKDKGNFTMNYNKFVGNVKQAGHHMNAFVDIMTCCAGAKAIYNVKVDEYNKKGYDSNKSHQMALFDAVRAVNESQQSQEAAYLSPLQCSSNGVAKMWNAFQNSTYSWGRKYIQWRRDISKDASKVETSLRNKYKQQDFDDARVEELVAMDMASWRTRKIALPVAYSLSNIAWQLGYSLPAIAAVYAGSAMGNGGDNDKWQFTWKELAKACATGLVSTASNSVLGGQVVSSLTSEVANFLLKTDVVDNDFKELGYEQDWKNVITKTFDRNFYFSEIEQYFNAIGKGCQQKDVFKMMFSTLDFATSVGTGVDLDVFANMMTSIHYAVTKDNMEAADILYALDQFTNAPEEAKKILVLSSRNGDTPVDVYRRYMVYLSEKRRLGSLQDLTTKEMSLVSTKIWYDILNSRSGNSNEQSSEDTASLSKVDVAEILDQASTEMREFARVVYLSSVGEESSLRPVHDKTDVKSKNRDLKKNKVEEEILPYEWILI